MVARNPGFVDGSFRVCRWFVDGSIGICGRMFSLIILELSGIVWTIFTFGQKSGQRVVRLAVAVAMRNCA